MQFSICNPHRPKPNKKGTIRLGVATRGHPGSPDAGAVFCQSLALAFPVMAQACFIPWTAPNNPSRAA